MIKICGVLFLFWRSQFNHPKFILFVLFFIMGHWITPLMTPPIIPSLILLFILLLTTQFIPPLLLIFALIAGSLNGTRWYHPPLDEQEIGHYSITAPVTLTGVVQKVKNSRYSQRIKIKLSTLYTQNMKMKMGGIIQLKNRTKKKINSGDLITCRTTLTPPLEKQNYGGFDRRFFMKKQKIYYQGDIRYGIDLEIIKGDHRSRMTQIKTSLKNKISGTLGNTPSAGLLQAIFLGDRSTLDPEFKEQLKRIGITHLFAISGFHIGILYLILLTLFKSLSYLPISIHRRIDLKSTALLLPLFPLFFYIWIIDFQVSALRAWLMITLFVGVKVYQHRGNPLSILALAALIILLIIPKSGYDIGFYLSFLAVTAIIVVVKPLDQRLKSKITNKIARWFCNYIILNSAIFLITTPVLLYLFHRVALTQFWANMIFIPLFTFLIYPIGLTVVVATLLSFHLELIQNQVYALFEQLVTISDHLSISWLAPINTTQLILLIIIMVSCITALYKKNRWYFLTLSLLILLPFISHSYPPSVYFLSVGNGDAILITTPQNQTILIDAGPKRKMGSGRYIITPHLDYLGIDQIDLMILTHQDEDHYGGLPYLAQHNRIKQIITNKPLQHPLDKLNIPTIIIKKRKRIIIDQMTLTLYTENSSGDKNNDSVITLLEYQGKRLLFTGDAESKREKIWLSKVQNSDIDLLKAGHHGSRKGSSTLFLKKTKPEITIISAGYHNRHGHPNRETLKRLKRANSNIFRTDQCGEIVVDLTPKKLTAIKPFCND